MIKRNLSSHLKKMLKKFPVLSLTGPRQSGKTTLLKSEFDDYKYFNLERIDHREMIMTDIIGFLKDTGPKVIFDEAQNIPELFSYIQVISDERGIPGQYILSGSQSFLLNENIPQSLAGRVSVNNLFPFDSNELQNLKERNVDKIILTGFYPRIFDMKIPPTDFYPSYLQTYIERDIRTLKSITNLNLFTRFLGLCAGRVGQIINLTSLANDTGVSVNTVKAWLSLLEASYIIYLLQPYYNNFRKRLIKSPKLYFYDTGIVSLLLKITDVETIRNHYLYGSLFENLVISDILKTFSHTGKTPSLYYWRESNGLEIDCIIECGDKLIAIEIKAGETFNKEFLKNLIKFNQIKSKIEIKNILIYNGDTSMKKLDISIFNWNDFSSSILDLCK